MMGEGNGLMGEEQKEGGKDKEERWEGNELDTLQEGEGQ